VFDWLKRRSKNQKMPKYSAAGKMPSRGVPSGLSEQEATKPTAHAETRSNVGCVSRDTSTTRESALRGDPYPQSTRVCDHRAVGGFTLFAGFQQSRSRSRILANSRSVRGC
jgi:hypothetical protein